VGRAIRRRTAGVSTNEENNPAAAAFMRVPPAMTRRLSALHSMFTVETNRGRPPVIMQAPPWPGPS